MMRIILVWLCLLSEVYPFPTLPSIVGKKNCCVSDSQDNGKTDVHNSKMYEPGENKGLFSQTENDKQYEETFTQTEKLFYENSGLYDTEDYFVNETLDIEDVDTKVNSVILINNLQISQEKKDITKNSSPNKQFNDSYNGTYIFDIYWDPVTSPEGDGNIGPTVDVPDSSFQRTNEYGERDPYYNMEGSAFADISNYSQSLVDVKNPTVHVPATDTHVNSTAECSEYEKFCKNSKKPSEENISKLDSYVTGVRNSIRRKTKGTAAATDTNMKNKMKGKKHFKRYRSGKMSISDKYYTTGKREKIVNGYKPKNDMQSGGHQPTQKNKNALRYQFSESSSESDSNSNQSFD